MSFLLNGIPVKRRQTSKSMGSLLGEYKMRTEYDFSEAKRNPYVKRLKKAVTIRLEPGVISYFKSLSFDAGIPYQNLINLYLLDCAKERRKLALIWKKQPARRSS
jgi:hypothetical protein